jgi:hypothetical protein
MKVGDLVKYSYCKKASTGIIVGFSDFILLGNGGEGDPIIRDNRSGAVRSPWRKNVEVISESR